MRLPIRLRLTAWYVALLAAIVVALGAFLVLRLRADLTADSDRRLDSAAQHIARGYAAEGAKDFHDVAGTVLPHGDALAQLVDGRGVVLVAHGGVEEAPVARDTALAVARTGAPRRATVEVGDPGTRYRAVAIPVERRGKRYVLVTAESLAPVDRSVHRVLILLLIGGPAVLLLTAASGWWLARKALLPVERMIEQADRMGDESLDRRLDVPRTEDELARLARTLNAMLDRVERGVADKRRLIADASHELRGPLTVMRSELDVTLADPALTDDARPVLESSRDEVDRMARMVDDMLTLATIDEDRLDLIERPVDLRELAETVVRRLEPRAAAAGVQVSVEGEDEQAVGDVLRLEHALANLLDNAIKFGGPGGPVEVTTWRSGEEVGVAVCDRGPGVPADQRERIFERFVRLDSARGRDREGSGLGLAIASEVARAHGGRAWAEPREGGGSRFAIALRAAEVGSRPAQPAANFRLPTRI